MKPIVFIFSLFFSLNAPAAYLNCAQENQKKDSASEYILSLGVEGETRSYLGKFGGVDHYENGIIYNRISKWQTRSKKEPRLSGPGTIYSVKSENGSGVAAVILCLTSRNCKGTVTVTDSFGSSTRMKVSCYWNERPEYQIARD